MRPGHCCAGCQQNEGIEQRQMPRIERFDAFRRPLTTKELIARELMHVRRKQSGVEIGPEPSDKKHHLGCNEQDHPISMGYLDDASVMALKGSLAGDVTPPADKHVKNTNGTGSKNERR